jgi:hypothetical protein
MGNKKTNIVVSLQIEGVHHWPECPIDEVNFLKYPHRHVFHIKCKKEVQHNDRDIEIIQLKRRIQFHLSNAFGSGYKNANGCDFGRMSCEDIADLLVESFQLNYCSVLEDNENGAEIIIKDE